MEPMLFRYVKRVEVCISFSPLFLSLLILYVFPCERERERDERERGREKEKRMTPVHRFRFLSFT